MKILHYSDRSSPDFLSLYLACDVLVTTGDLTFFDFNGLSEISPKKAAFGVYGNHDSGGYLEELGIINLHNRIFEYQGLTWGGFQGCLRYKNSELMFTEDEARTWAKSFPPVDILLLHAGPKGMLDDDSDEVHSGSKSVAEYVQEKKPKIVFVGHQYSDDTLTIKQTTLFRTYGARLIEV